MMSVDRVNNKLMKVLSFGGNGMIGSEVLSRLIHPNDDDDGSNFKQTYDITMVSRGSWPFDTKTNIAPHVRFLRYDRDNNSGNNNRKNTTERLLLEAEMEEMRRKQEWYYAVLDFSGFEPEWVRDSIELLRGIKVRVYIYVSTDSVYEVCKESSASVFLHDDGSYRKKASIETDAVRPDDDDKRERLNEEDSYGDEKLGCEELLVQQRFDEQQDDMASGFPYVSLRFADVIGPRDAGSRFSSYFLWVKYFSDLSATSTLGVPPLHVTKDTMELSSITYVSDAASAILMAMKTPSSWDEAYNIACEETFNTTLAVQTIREFVVGSSISSGRRLPPIQRRNGKDAIAFYPSTTRGPIDVSKAKKRLHFKPTPIRTVLERTCQWYENELYQNERAREEMVNDFAEDMLGEEDDKEERRSRLIEAVLSRFKDDH